MTPWAEVLRRHRLGERLRQLGSRRRQPAEQFQALVDDTGELAVLAPYEAGTDGRVGVEEPGDRHPGRVQHEAVHRRADRHGTAGGGVELCGARVAPARRCPAARASPPRRPPAPARPHARAPEIRRGPVRRARSDGRKRSARDGVGVDEPGHDGAPAEVDDGRVLAGEREQVGRSADGGDAVAGDSDGLADAAGIVHRMDVPADEEEGRPARRSSCLLRHRACPEPPAAAAAPTASPPPLPATSCRPEGGEAAHGAGPQSRRRRRGPVAEVVVPGKRAAGRCGPRKRPARASTPGPRRPRRPPLGSRPAGRRWRWPGRLPARSSAVGRGQRPRGAPLAAHPAMAEDVGVSVVDAGAGRDALEDLPQVREGGTPVTDVDGQAHAGSVGFRADEEDVGVLGGEQGAMPTRRRAAQYSVLTGSSLPRGTTTRVAPSPRVLTCLARPRLSRTTERKPSAPMTRSDRRLDLSASCKVPSRSRPRHGARRADSSAPASVATLRRAPCRSARNVTMTRSARTSRRRRGQPVSSTMRTSSSLTPEALRACDTPTPSSGCRLFSFR